MTTDWPHRSGEVGHPDHPEYGSAELLGRVVADRLILNGQALLEDPHP